MAVVLLKRLRSIACGSVFPLRRLAGRCCRDRNEGARGFDRDPDAAPFQLRG